MIALKEKISFSLFFFHSLTASYLEGLGKPLEEKGFLMFVLRKWPSGEPSAMFKKASQAILLVSSLILEDTPLFPQFTSSSVGKGVNGSHNHWVLLNLRLNRKCPQLPTKGV